MKKGMKLFAVAVSVLLLAVAVAACSEETKSYNDGTFVGVSGKDDKGAYGEVTITIEEGTVTDCKFVTWQEDGSIKDENYGKVNGQISNADYYAKAQLAVKAMKQYAQDFLDKKDIKEVKSVTGATIAHSQFTEAVESALKKAEK
ncbi:MAG: FMN-binding protein [Clostridiaceae bacterium]|jgi:major membrane immunogen (membrane-anchored lipoprotein)|nr:FMN-binding protein [Clostridiaceae bacterium]